MTRCKPFRIAAFLVSLLFVLPLGAAKTPGVFRGTLVENPTGTPITGYLFLRSRNGNVRRVEMSKAVVAYDESVPKEQQVQAASEALKPGADVRVTAEQEGDGEWHASRIEILASNSTPQSIEDFDHDQNNDDDDGYVLQQPGSNRPVVRKS